MPCRRLAATASARKAVFGMVLCFSRVSRNVLSPSRPIGYRHLSRGARKGAFHRCHALLSQSGHCIVGSGAWLRRLLSYLSDAQPCAADVFSLPATGPLLPIVWKH